jgi:hypothetical protein
MWEWIAFGVLALVGLGLGVYFWLCRDLQQRALRALRAIENSLGTAGHISGMRWTSDSSFEVPAKVVHPIFQRVVIEVALSPVMLPFRKKPVEVMTFHADLDHAPGFSMNFENLRWFARTDKRLSSESPGWQVATAPPVVLTTRMDWERDVTSAIYTMLHTEQREHLNVTFRRTSPNFSATFPLTALFTDSGPFDFLTVLREMAEGVFLKAS